MNIRIQSIERKKKVAEYIHAHNGRVSIMALAASLAAITVQPRIIFPSCRPKVWKSSSKDESAIRVKASLRT